jgi:predicted NAD/FAD-dependent oxidoreductase
MGHAEDMSRDEDRERRGRGTIDGGSAPIVIVGAGLSGLVAAQTLQEQGHDVVVVDRGTVLGGRLATATLQGAGGRPARLDHGAQFFTVRSPDFAELVHAWRRNGLVREWCQGFVPGGDGHPRYCAEGGMATIAAYLASSLDVRLGVDVHAVSGHDGSLIVHSHDGQRFESDRVILTAPVPQSLALCENGWLPIPEQQQDELQTVRYVPCLALVVTLDGPGAVPEPGGIQLGVDDDPTWTFVADNRAKGISDVPAITLHANAPTSEERIAMLDLDGDADHLRAYLLAEAQRWLGGATPINVAVHRWDQARPTVTHPGACVVVEPIPGTRLGFAGDGFADAKVEGAALSGLAVAECIAASGS